MIKSRVRGTVSVVLNRRPALHLMLIMNAPVLACHLNSKDSKALDITHKKHLSPGTKEGTMGFTADDR